MADLLHPDSKEEKRKHKKKRLVQSPNRCVERARTAFFSRDVNRVLVRPPPRPPPTAPFPAPRPRPCVRSFFMDVRCPNCTEITTVFSHAQTVVVCAGCATMLCHPSGGKARLTEGCSFRKKTD